MGSNVKKARVSWPSDSMLCQVKMFQKEDYPAKVGAQTCSKSKASKDLHHGTVYSTRPPNIPLITWKPPPKFILSDHWLVASGEESTETGSENLRIAKVLEAFYPHHSLIPPTRPSISPAAVQVDDTITPTIRLTPIEEDEDEQPESPAIQSSQSSKTPPSQFGHGPDMTLAALLNTKEQGSPVDADLLVKFLTDPIIINNLLNAAAAKPLLETGNNNNTTKPPPQHVTTSSANSPPGNGVTPVLAAHLVLNTYPLSCARKPLPRVEESLEPSSVVVSEPQNQSSPTSGTWNMSRVLESAGTVTDTQSAYQMNITRDDYFKNLIREHGGVVAPATNKKRV
ncbi:Zinc finger CCCH domain-containing protein 68 [Raphanus sativus]|nr:Zinc finger CCCH domain-containing protein 68 [Raphanus sativus]